MRGFFMYFVKMTQKKTVYFLLVKKHKKILKILTFPIDKV